MIIVFVAITLGFVVGGILGYTNGLKRKKKMEAAEPPSSGETNAPVNPVTPLVDPAKFIQLLTLWREKETSKLHIETSGHLLATVEPLNQRQKKRFIDLIKELAEWLKIPPDAIAENIRVVESPDVVNPSPPYGAKVSADFQGNESQNQQHISASDPVKTMPIPQPPEPAAVLSIQPETPPKPIYSAIPRKAPPVPVEAPQKSKGTMVEQIDVILQEVIENSDKPDRKIRLVEEPRDGVAVWVDHQQFIGVDAVPDPSVKELIRQAVKEWDRRTDNRFIP
jgi:hypothetical protein